MGLELTVLGSAGSHPMPGRVCSGYLVRHGDTNLMLDAGNGSTANLQRYVRFTDLDAVVISHRHVDHCVDLIGAFYALRFDPAAAERGSRLPLYAPAEVYDSLTGLMSADSAHAFGDVFEHHLVEPGDRREVGPLQLRFAHSEHPVPTVSTRIEVDGAALVYSGDSAGGQELVEVARGADLFLCEATWHGDAADYPPGIHLTAKGAGAIAAEAGVGKLVLTHLTGLTDPDRALTEAAEAFDGPIELAQDLQTHRIG
jgi:ribonuclease BN (tRNA processing enzyme)